MGQWVMGQQIGMGHGSVSIPVSDPFSNLSRRSYFCCINTSPGNGLLATFRAYRQRAGGLPPPPGTHRRRSSVKFRGGGETFARKICMKDYQNARILHNNCPKNIFQIFFFWGGGLPPSPTPLHHQRKDVQTRV